MEALIGIPGRPPCTLSDCELPNHGRGYCRKHYKRFMSTGDPLGTKQRPQGMSLAEVIDYFVIKGEREDDCWGWRSSVDSDGYPIFWWQGTNRKVLRFAYALAWGPISRELVVRHACDNAECLNPRHLLSGTNADNSRDTIERGRLGGSRRLTDAECIELLMRYQAGESQASIARGLGVSRTAVRYHVNKLKEGVEMT